ncbi:MAG: NAD(P)H-hydrate epimerase [Candidatus Buchananbacteria bacterium CG10_big_fil_rev_8_21_14_0_10_42_9]|uniref:NAD(P)H-hydrate epimerase n=1 Tax=Candidatus Buchananbacteria bacterium CG10_big_fil_rev_8_21_14_0_10_42_9 TaxID=1974526 RepID=A0A2H0W2Y8_9BACT|nr:MAG: NAD(P)H-hydrate epimerase [Candidatus Buchananbacteria bacterium CG10_big_fil_rev_8_21_14_0_10_42_9]
MQFTTAKQMERLDELAVANGLEIRQMMELAGWHMVELFRTLKIKKTARVVAVAGKGNKGGDALSAARHLVNHGYKNVAVVLISSKLKPDPLHHLRLLKKMKTPTISWTEGAEAKSAISKGDVIIDGLIGYHLDGAPRGVFAKAIQSINQSKATVIAYDLPSGLHATTGKCYEPCVKSLATLTLAAPKKCFRTLTGKRHSGKVFIGDIGIPLFLYRQVIKNYKPIFKPGSGLVQLEK